MTQTIFKTCNRLGCHRHSKAPALPLFPWKLQLTCVISNSLCSKASLQALVPKRANDPDYFQNMQSRWLSSTFQSSYTSTISMEIAAPLCDIEQSPQTIFTPCNWALQGRRFVFCALACIPGVGHNTGSKT